MQIKTWESTLSNRSLTLTYLLKSNPRTLNPMVISPLVLRVLNPVGSISLCPIRMTKDLHPEEYLRRRNWRPVPKPPTPPSDPHSPPETQQEPR